MKHEVLLALLGYPGDLIQPTPCSQEEEQVFECTALAKDLLSDGEVSALNRLLSRTHKLKFMVDHFVNSFSVQEAYSCDPIINAFCNIFKNEYLKGYYRLITEVEELLEKDNCLGITFIAAQIENQAPWIDVFYNLGMFVKGLYDDYPNNGGVDRTPLKMFAVDITIGVQLLDKIDTIRSTGFNYSTEIIQNIIEKLELVLMKVILHCIKMYELQGSSEYIDSVTLPKYFDFVVKTKMSEALKWSSILSKTEKMYVRLYNQKCLEDFYREIHLLYYEYDELAYDYTVKTHHFFDFLSSLQKYLLDSDFAADIELQVPRELQLVVTDAKLKKYADIRRMLTNFEQVLEKVLTKFDVKTRLDEYKMNHLIQQVVEHNKFIILADYYLLVKNLKSCKELTKVIKYYSKYLAKSESKMVDLETFIADGRFHSVDEIYVKLCDTFEDLNVRLNFNEWLDGKK